MPEWYCLRVTSSPPPPLRARSSRPTFSPRYTLLLLYFFVLVVLYCFLFALPALVEAYRSLPPGAGELTPEELAVASEAARTALAGRVYYAVAAAAVTLGVGLWSNAVPGLRRA
jgi:ABC-type Fe3+ transport system permease subunit